MTGNPSRAFAIWFHDLEQWDVLSALMRVSHTVSFPISALGELVAVRFSPVSVEDAKQGKVRMIDRVSFDGEVFAGAKSATRMTQYLAMPGDLVISKIRARQGSVGLVGSSDGAVSVTIHYRVLIPDTKKADPLYLWLVLRSSYCRRQFLAATGGAMKGEISEEALLRIKIPLPPLETQRAILAEWRKAKARIAAIEARVREAEAGIPGLIYAALGTPAPHEDKARERLMVLRWSEIDRWSFGYLARKRAGLLGFSKSKYPIQLLGDHLLETANGYCIKPVGRQTANHMLKLNALTPGGLDLSQTKFIDVPESVARRFCLKKDDLLICRSVGSFDLVAKCAVVPADAPNVLFPDIIIRARLRQSLLPDFVREVMQTPLGRSHFQSNARTAVGMWKIGADDIANFPLPVPPLDEQRKILEQARKVRSRIAREREEARETARQIETNLEAWLLGKK